MSENCKHWGHADGEWRYFCCACSGLPNGCSNCQEGDVAAMELVAIRDALISQSEPWWRIPTDTIIAALGRAVAAEAKLARVEELVDRWAVAPGSECSGGLSASEVAEFGLPRQAHYPEDPRGAAGCDGCPAAMADDSAHRQALRQLREALSGDLTASEGDGGPEGHRDDNAGDGRRGAQEGTA